MWSFCIIDAVFDTQILNTEVVHNSCSCSIDINSSPWYRVHAASVNACQIAVEVLVLQVVSIVVVVVVSAIAAVAVCMYLCTIRSTNSRSGCGVRYCCVAVCMLFLPGQ